MTDVKTFVELRVLRGFSLGSRETHRLLTAWTTVNEGTIYEHSRRFASAPAATRRRRDLGSRIGSARNSSPRSVGPGPLCRGADPLAGPAGLFSRTAQAAAARSLQRRR